MAFAAVVWLNLLPLVSGALESFVLVVLLVGLVWLLLMGVTLLRVDQDRVPVAD